jgi:hypothetical protein
MDLEGIWIEDEDLIVWEFVSHADGLNSTVKFIISSCLVSLKNDRFVSPASKITRNESESKQTEEIHSHFRFGMQSEWQFLEEMLEIRKCFRRQKVQLSFSVSLLSWYTCSLYFKRWGCLEFGWWISLLLFMFLAMIFTWLSNERESDPVVASRYRSLSVMQISRSDH